MLMAGLPLCGTASNRGGMSTAQVFNGTAPVAGAIDV